MRSVASLLLKHTSAHNTHWYIQSHGVDTRLCFLLLGMLILILTPNSSFSVGMNIRSEKGESVKVSLAGLSPEFKREPHYLSAGTKPREWGGGWTPTNYLLFHFFHKDLLRS